MVKGMKRQGVIYQETMADSTSASTPKPPKATRILTIRPRTHFFRLPRELRDMVYELTLVQPSYWEKPHEAQCPQVNPRKAWQWPVHRTWDETVDEADRNNGRPLAWLTLMEQLTSGQDRRTTEQVNDCFDAGCHSRLGIDLRAVNRQIHEETEDLFWSRNVFCYDSPRDMVHQLVVCVKKNGQMPGTCQKPCMPRSAKAKVQRLSFLQHRDKSYLDYEDRRTIVQALGELPSLRHVEMPVDMVMHHLQRLAGLSLLFLATVRATEIRPAVIGDGDNRARVDLYLSKDIDIPRRCKWHPLHYDRCGHPCYKRRQRHPDNAPCNQCSWKLSELVMERLEPWKNRYDFQTRPDTVMRTMAIAEHRFNKRVPKQLLSGEPRTISVCLGGESKDEEVVRVHGLPILDAAARLQLLKAEQKAKPKVQPTSGVRSRKRASYHFTPVDDEVAVPCRLDKRRPRERVVLDLRARLPEPADRVDKLTVRSERRKEEAQFEAQRMKSETKTGAKELRRAMEQLTLERKAAKKRSGRRESHDA
ncbi:hypothetical protein LTR56_018378 [Elasticomyces elasticus]|nr:hypothetical protein LTR56_018378 [Elasticomyces elasticus]